jgi:hypothetical protein
MTMPSKPYLAVLKVGLLLGIGCATLSASTLQTPPEDRAWELRANPLQAVGLHFPSDMASVWSIMKYQVNQATTNNNKWPPLLLEKHM